MDRARGRDQSPETPSFSPSVASCRSFTTSLQTDTLTLLPALAAASQVHHPHVPRQTSSPGASACLASIESVVSSFPTIPRELVGITDIKPITDPCNYTPPATMATAFSSFQSVVVSWVSENWPKVTAVVEQCPEVKVDVEGFEKAWDILVCTSTAGSGGKTGGVSTATTLVVGAETTSTAVTTGTVGITKTTAGGTAAGGAQSTTRSAAGVRETGFVAGVIAAVGFAGAAVAL